MDRTRVQNGAPRWRWSLVGRGANKSLGENLIGTIH